jgi:hypothetical protein
MKPGNGLRSSELRAELALDVRHIGLVDQRRVRQVPLLLGLLLRQNVTLEGVLPLDLSSPRELKALFRA